MNEKMKKILDRFCTNFTRALKAQDYDIGKTCENQQVYRKS